jgi:penicillin amidase
MRLYSLVICVLCFVACDDTDSQTTNPAADMNEINGDGMIHPTDQGVEADAGQLDLGPRTEEDLIKSIAPVAEWYLPALTAPVHILRTEGNIPHIYASNRSDLGRALGFTLAQDRYFVMDLQRRLGLGTISALLGDLALRNDMESRLTGMPYVADRLTENLSPSMRAYLGSVVEGINAYVRAVQEGEFLPPTELSIASGLLGVPNPADLMTQWSIRDLAGMTAVVMYQTTFDTEDIQRSAAAASHADIFLGAPHEALRRAGFLQDILGDVRPLFDFTSTDGLGLNGAIPPNSRASDGAGAGAHSQVSSRSIQTLLNNLTPVLRRLERRVLRHQREGIGSNTWSVSGRVTKDGFTLVAGDGHLPLAVPAITYQVGLDTRVLGDDGFHQTGILLAQLPVLGAGTNGHIAWSQVNPYSDTVDWYQEEIQLDNEGRPAFARFENEWIPLSQVAETYEIANAPGLGSIGRVETHNRYTTADGRWLTAIEGRVLDPDEDPPEDAHVVHMLGSRVIPSDLDADGVISAITFDYAAFDASDFIEAVDRAGMAENAAELRESMRGLVGSGLYTTGGDNQGNIIFSAYQGFPCRTYLPRDENGRWAQGADTRFLLDGTRFGGFTLPTADGVADESTNDDPYRCVIPFDDVPQGENAPAGYFVAANNDPGNLTNNGALYDDEWYIGGPWSSTRSATISDAIESGIAANEVDIDFMASVQAKRQSRLGEVFVPYVLDAISGAQGLDAKVAMLSPAEMRLSLIFQDDPQLLETFRTRLQAWSTSGFDTPSGVATFYHQPTEADIKASSATMIFNVWLRQFSQLTWGDEGIENAWTLPSAQYRIIGLKRLLAGRGPGNPNGLQSWYEPTGESILFDRQETEFIETSRELILQALMNTFDYLSAPTNEAGLGGFGTENMDSWLWGMRHQARFESLLASFLDNNPTFGAILDLFSITTRTLPLDTEMGPDDPRKDLKWFPRGGDMWAVDAANPGIDGDDFTHGNGPVMRMIIGLKDGEVIGLNVIPGGQSGRNDSPHFADQLRLWLENNAYPLRFHTLDVVSGATGREILWPTPSE